MRNLKLWRLVAVAFCLLFGAGIWLVPAWTQGGRALIDQIKLAARRHPAGSLESRTSMLAAVQRILHPTWRNLTRQQALARIEKFAARLARRLATGSLPSNPPPANFQGNLTGIQAPSADALAILRQADCSLTLFTFTYALKVPPTISIPAPITNYEQVLHATAQLTTPVDSFPNGCADSTLGVGSRPIVYLGLTTQNLHMFAATGYDALAGGNALLYGTEDPTTHTVHSFQVDSSDLNITAVAAGDLNGDGLADVIGVDGYGASATITVHIANADGTLGAGTAYSLPGSIAEAAVVGDANGDGNADVVVATLNSFTYQEQISILTGNGDGTLNPALSFTVTTPLGPNSASFAIANLITADLRGTGYKDIVASNGLVLLNDGQGNFTVVPAPAFAPSLATSNYGPNLAAGDLNGDGKLDLVVNDGEQISTYLGNGDGTFSTGAAYATINDVGYVTVTDLDGDGNLDIFVGLGNGGFFYGDQFGVNSAYALLGHGDGTFAGAPAAAVSYNGRNLADLNGDKKLDLIGVNGSAFTVYPGKGDGTFSTGATLNVSSFTYNSRNYSNQGVSFFTQTDLNGDGYPDLVWSTGTLELSTQRPFLLIALNNGDGTFAAPQVMVMPSAFSPPDFDVNFNATDVQAADFNRDGKNDLIIAFSSTSYSTHANVQGFLILPGNGDGTFGSPTTLLTYNSATPGTFIGPAIAAIADVNGDKIPDLIVAQMTGTPSTGFGSQLLLFLGNGDGTFGASTVLPTAPNPTIPTVYEPSPVVVKDMNGDGIPDLVTLGQDSNQENAYLDISLGNGDGTFSQPVGIILPGGGVVALSGLAVADFNGDGKMDVAVASFIAQANGIYFGNGDGTLAPFKDPYGDILPSEQFILLAAGFATTADLNGDGLPDILAGNVALLNLAGR